MFSMAFPSVIPCHFSLPGSPSGGSVGTYRRVMWNRRASRGTWRAWTCVRPGGFCESGQRFVGRRGHMPPPGRLFGFQGSGSARVGTRSLMLRGSLMPAGSEAGARRCARKNRGNLCRQLLCAPTSEAAWSPPIAARESRQQLTEQMPRSIR